MQEPAAAFGLADLWLASLTATGRSPRTVAIYRYALDQLREWRQGATVTTETVAPLETVSRFEALAFTKHCLDRYKANGVRSRIKSLRAFYGWCIEEGLCTENPFSRVQVTVPDEAQPILSDEDLDRILASAKKHSRRDYAIVVLLADTGCRKGEAAGVLFEDVDLRSGVIRFRVSKTRARTTPLSDRAVVALGHWLRQRGVGSGPLWSSRHKSITDPYALVRWAVETYSKGTLSPHSLRRAFAVKALSRGMSETSLMRIAGWTSTNMIRTYVAAQADQLADAEFRRLMA